MDSNTSKCDKYTDTIERVMVETYKFHEQMEAVRDGEKKWRLQKMAEKRAVQEKARAAKEAAKQGGGGRLYWEEIIENNK